MLYWRPTQQIASFVPYGAAMRLQYNRMHASRTIPNNANRAEPLCE
jgi:hypothetical protein